MMDIVLADIPERVRLRELTAILDQRRDQIAEQDLEIELLRAQLAKFEHHYAERLRGEHAELWRIESLVRHLERWANTVREAYTQVTPAQRERVLKRAERHEERRQRELEEMREEKQKPAPAPPPEDSQTRAVALKKAYRALARRYHPDLARTEPERLYFSDMMTKINERYHAGDLEWLERLAEQAKGSEIDEELDVEKQIEVLEKRLKWFDKVLANLKEERRQLERSKTCELMRNVEQAAAMGRDLIAEIQAELISRASSGHSQIKEALRYMEKEVAEYNKRSAGGDLVKPLSGAMQRFDPFADKQLVRLGLEELATLEVSREGRELSDWLLEIAETHPALLDAVLFAYVCDLSPYPLPGLETFEELKLRFAALQDEWTLERALVEGDQVIQYGVKQASKTAVHMGLGLRSHVVHEAVLMALKQFAIRRAFRRVLSVLGEREHCDECGKDVFSVPLFRTRGLDDFRALVCPSCGTTFRSYWMPKGEDVQAVLNNAFIDFEMVSEWSIQWGRASVAVQLAESELDTASVGDLKRRIHADILKRNEIEVPLSQIWLEQDGKRVGEKKALGAITGNVFTLRFADDAPVRESEALEMVKHRIRTRFSGG